MSEEFSVMGKRLPPADAVAKVKGEIKFASDMYLVRSFETTLG